MNLTDLSTRDDIGKVLAKMKLNGIGVEVGVAFGENAEKILGYSTLELLMLVDPWDYVPNENPKGYGDAIKDWQGCYDYCKSKVARFGKRAFMLKESSEEASKKIKDNSLDFVYIDGNHMSPFVDKDIEYWYPKVKPGGIFGGHDYHMVKREDYQCDVKEAVDKFFKGKEVNIHVTKDSDPSWYVVK